MTNATYRRLIVLVMALISVLGIFICDVQVPLGVALWVLYLVPILVVAQWSQRIDIYVVAAISTGLLALGFFFSPPGIPGFLEVFNRVLQIAALWLVAILLAHRRQMEEKLLAYQVKLEEQGGARIADLEQELAARRQAEAALGDALGKYSTIFDMAPIGISLTDSMGKLVETNREAEHILGIPQRYHLQRNVDAVEQRFVRPDGTPMPTSERPGTRAHQEGRRIDNVEMGITRADGSTVWVSVNAAPISLTDYGMSMVFADISERKQREDSLRRSEENFTKVFHASPVGIAITRPSDGCHLDANIAYMQMVGYTRDKLIGHSSVELGITDANFDALVAATVQSGRVVHNMGASLVTNEGETIDVLLSVESIEMNGEPCWLAILADIGEQKRGETAFRNAVVELKPIHAGNVAMGA